MAREDADYLADNCAFHVHVETVLCVTGDIASLIRLSTGVGWIWYSKNVRDGVAGGNKLWVDWYRRGMKVLEDRNKS